jgi:hypothetical protein
MSPLCCLPAQPQLDGTLTPRVVPDGHAIKGFEVGWPRSRRQLRVPGRSAHGVRRLWEGVRRPDGTVTRTFAIITTDANKMMAKVHDRMPMILESDWPM